MYRVHSRPVTGYCFEDIVQNVCHNPTVVFLDSSDRDSPHSTLSIIAWDPIFTLKSVAGVVTGSGSNENVIFKTGLADALAQVFSDFAVEGCGADLPFYGGLIGYFGYECARENPLYTHCFRHVSVLPDSWFSVFKSYVVWDHRTDTGYRLWLLPDGDLLDDDWIPNFDKNYSYGNVTASPTPEVSFLLYDQLIADIQSLIASGDIYQVNYSVRFSAPYVGDLWPFYQALRHVSPAPFSTFIRFEGVEIACSSPERFVRMHSRVIETHPIKGTSRRDSDPARDLALSESLSASEKNRAELMMIVDLMRNDLSRLCVFGSVVVTELMAVECYAQVFQLVATIEGQLTESVSHITAIMDLLPGGSITGAPKRRAMEIIRDMEVTPRSLYTGSIGYFGFNDISDFNIAIRTAYRVSDTVYFHGGGGIVSDSNSKDEWAEILVKIAGLLSAINAMA